MTLVDDEEELLCLLASGLVAAYQAVAEGTPLRLPYPPPLQRSLDRLTLRCLRADIDPPQGVPELLRWCELPLGQWPVPLGGGDLAGDVLFDLGTPTRACQEWALDTTDVEGELFENAVIADVRRACRAAGKPDSYVAFRRLVISDPVLTELEMHQRLMEPDLAIIAEQVKACYVPAPIECHLGGDVVQCADCANLLVRSPDGPRCINDRCTRSGTVRRGRRLPTVQGVRWLVGPVRTFVSAPGQAELRLAKQIAKLGVDVDLWPNYDTYDLQISFADGKAWAIDVKDWSNPVRLARQLGPIPRDPEWDKAFYVPAREAVTAVPGYLATLRNRSRPFLRGTGVEITTERGLTQKVRTKMGVINA